MTEMITDFINKDIPFLFVKFGDGEYNAANRVKGNNCDNDSYTERLGDGILQAIQYTSLTPNAYCGCWHTGTVPDFFNSVVSGKINWVDYHICILDNHTFENQKKFLLFQAIQQSKRKKVLIGNELLGKAKTLFHMDEHIVVPYNNWFSTDFDNILKKTTECYKDDDIPFVITCAGMGSKVLLMELHKLFPKGIFLDIGSGLDYVCTKKCSRGWSYSYEQLEAYFRDLLPSNWNDEQFEWIYQKAKTHIGLHLQ